MVTSWSCPVRRRFQSHPEIEPNGPRAGTLYRPAEVFRSGRLGTFLCRPRRRDYPFSQAKMLCNCSISRLARVLAQAAKSSFLVSWVVGERNSCVQVLFFTGSQQVSVCGILASKTTSKLIVLLCTRCWAYLSALGEARHHRSKWHGH